MFFYEETVQPMVSVLCHLKSGDKVLAEWPIGRIPVELVIFPNGGESIEVVQQGPPAAYRTLASLFCEERVFGA